jgi:chromosome segregation ATPase
MGIGVRPESDIFQLENGNRYRPSPDQSGMTEGFTRIISADGKDKKTYVRDAEGGMVREEIWKGEQDAPAFFTNEDAKIVGKQRGQAPIAVAVKNVPMDREKARTYVTSLGGEFSKRLNRRINQTEGSTYKVPEYIVFVGELMKRKVPLPFFDSETENLLKNYWEQGVRNNKFKRNANGQALIGDKEIEEILTLTRPRRMRDVGTIFERMSSGNVVTEYEQDRFGAGGAYKTDPRIRALEQIAKESAGAVAPTAKEQEFPFGRGLNQLTQEERQFGQLVARLRRPESLATPTEKQAFNQQMNAELETIKKEYPSTYKALTSILGEKFDIDRYKKLSASQKEDVDSLLTREGFARNTRTLKQGEIYGTLRQQTRQGVERYRERSAFDTQGLSEFETEVYKTAGRRTTTFFSPIAGLVGGGARTIDFVNGLLRPLAEANVPIVKETYGLLRRQAEKGRAFAEGNAENGIVATVLGAGFGLTQDISRFLLLARIPGMQGSGVVAQAANLSLDLGLQSSGRGENLQAVGLQFIKGGGLGALMPGAGKVSGAVERYLFQKVSPSFVSGGKANQIIDDLIGLSTTAEATALKTGLVTKAAAPGTLRLGGYTVSAAEAKALRESAIKAAEKEFKKKLSPEDIALLASGKIKDPAMRRFFIASKIASGLTEVGVIGGGTYAVARGTGSDKDASINEAILMLGFHFGLKGAGWAAGKYFKKDGKVYTVDPKGKIYLAEGIPDRYVDYTLGPAPTPKQLGPASPKDELLATLGLKVGDRVRGNYDGIDADGVVALNKKGDVVIKTKTKDPNVPNTIRLTKENPNKFKKYDPPSDGGGGSSGGTGGGPRGGGGGGFIVSPDGTVIPANRAGSRGPGFVVGPDGTTIPKNQASSPGVRFVASSTGVVDEAFVSPLAKGKTAYRLKDGRVQTGTVQGTAKEPFVVWNEGGVQKRTAYKREGWSDTPSGMPKEIKPLSWLEEPEELIRLRSLLKEAENPPAPKPGQKPPSALELKRRENAIRGYKDRIATLERQAPKGAPNVSLGKARSWVAEGNRLIAEINSLVRTRNKSNLPRIANLTAKLDVIEAAVRANPKVKAPRGIYREPLEVLRRWQASGFGAQGLRELQESAASLRIAREVRKRGLEMPAGNTPISVLQRWEASGFKSAIIEPYLPKPKLQARRAAVQAAAEKAGATMPRRPHLIPLKDLEAWQASDFNPNKKPIPPMVNAGGSPMTRREQLFALAAKKEEIAADIDVLLQARDTADANIAALKRARAAKKAELKNANKTQTRQINKEIKALTEQIDTLKGKKGEINKALGRKRKALSITNKDMAETAGENPRLGDALATVDEEIKGINSKIKDLTKLLKDDPKDGKVKVNREKRLERAEQELETLTAQRARIEEQIAKERPLTKEEALERGTKKPSPETDQIFVDKYKAQMRDLAAQGRLNVRDPKAFDDGIRAMLEAHQRSRPASEAVIAKLKRKQAQIDNRLKSLKQDLTSQQTRLKTARSADAAGLRESIARLESKIKKIESDKRAIGRQIASALEPPKTTPFYDVAAAEKALRTFGKEIREEYQKASLSKSDKQVATQKQREIKSLTNDLQDINTQRDKIVQKTETLKAEVKKATEGLEKATKASNVATKSIIKLKGKLGRTKPENYTPKQKEFAKQLKQAEKDFATAEKQKTVFEKQKAIAERRLDDHASATRENFELLDFKEEAVKRNLARAENELKQVGRLKETGSEATQRIRQDSPEVRRQRDVRKRAEDAYQKEVGAWNRKLDKPNAIQKQIDGIKQEIADLQTARTNARSKKGRAEIDAQIKQKQADIFRAERAKASAVIDAANARKNPPVKKIQRPLTADETVKLLEQRKAARQAIIDKPKQIERQINKVRREIDELKAARARKRTDASRATVDEAIQGKTRELRNLQNARRKALTAADEAKNTPASLDDVAPFQKDSQILNALDREVASLRAKVTKKEASIAKVRAELKTANEVLSAASEKTLTANTPATAAAAKLERAKAQSVVNDLNAKLKRGGNALAKLEKEIAKVQSDAANLRNSKPPVTPLKSSGADINVEVPRIEPTAPEMDPRVIQAVKEDYAAGLKISRLAKDYGLTAKQVSEIVGKEVKPAKTKTATKTKAKTEAETTPTETKPSTKTATKPKEKATTKEETPATVTDDVTDDIAAQLDDDIAPEVGGERPEITQGLISNIKAGIKAGLSEDDMARQFDLTKQEVKDILSGKLTAKDAKGATAAADDATTASNAGDRPATQTDPGLRLTEESTQISKTSKATIVEVDGVRVWKSVGNRRYVLVDIDGVTVPFYRSSGLGGKAETKAGSWYPFFGREIEEGWINKTNGKDMSVYYGSAKWEKVGKWLDETYQTDRHPLGDFDNTNADIRFNQFLKTYDVTPTTSSSGTMTVYENINKMLRLMGEEPFFSNLENNRPISRVTPESRPPVPPDTTPRTVKDLSATEKLAYDKAAQTVKDIKGKLKEVTRDLAPSERFIAKAEAKLAGIKPKDYTPEQQKLARELDKARQRVETIKKKEANLEGKQRVEQQKMDDLLRTPAKEVTEAGDFGQASNQVKNFLDNDQVAFTELAETFAPNVMSKFGQANSTKAITDAIAKSVGKTRMSDMTAADFDRFLKDNPTLSGDVRRRILEAKTGQSAFDKVRKELANDPELQDALKDLSFKIKTWKDFNGTDFAGKLTRIGEKYVNPITGKPFTREQTVRVVNDLLGARVRRSFDTGKPELVSRPVGPGGKSGKASGGTAQAVVGKPQGIIGRTIQRIKEAIFGKAPGSPLAKEVDGYSAALRSTAKATDDALASKGTFVAERGTITADAKTQGLLNRMFGNQEGTAGFVAPAKAVDDVVDRLMTMSQEAAGKGNTKLAGKYEALARALDDQSRQGEGLLKVNFKSEQHPTISALVKEEENLHWADFKSRQATTSDASTFSVSNVDINTMRETPAFAKAEAAVRKQYGDISDEQAFAEVVAKAFRSDAEGALGISAAERAQIIQRYAKTLNDLGITPEQVRNNFRNTSRRGEEFAQAYEAGYGSPRGAVKDGGGRAPAVGGGDAVGAVGGRQGTAKVNPNRLEGGRLTGEVRKDARPQVTQGEKAITAPKDGIGVTAVERNGQVVLRTANNPEMVLSPSEAKILKSVKGEERQAVADIFYTSEVSTAQAVVGGKPIPPKFNSPEYYQQKVDALKGAGLIAYDTAATSRSFITSLDVSTAGRQNWMLYLGGRRYLLELTPKGQQMLQKYGTLVDPRTGKPFAGVTQYGYKGFMTNSLKEMFYSFNRKHYAKLRQSTQNDPLYDLAQAAGLDMGMMQKVRKGDIVHDTFRIGKVIEMKPRSGKGPNIMAVELKDPKTGAVKRVKLDDKWDQMIDMTTGSSTYERYPGRFTGEAPIFQTAPKYFKDMLAKGDYEGILRMSPRYARRIATWHVRASSRSFDGAVVSARFQYFKNLVEESKIRAALEGKTLDVKSLEGMADTINTWTGYVKRPFGAKDQTLNILNTLIFSPRLAASRIKLLMTPALFAKLPEFARAEAIKGYGRQMGLMALLLGGASAAGAEIVFNDLTDPGSFRIRAGGYSTDITAGQVQWLTYGARMSYAIAKKVAPEYVKKETGRRRKSEDVLSEMTAISGRQLRKKMAPVPGSIVNYLTGANVLGEPTSGLGEIVNLITPITARNAIEHFEMDGAYGLAPTLADIAGFSTTRLKTAGEYQRQIDALKTNPYLSDTQKAWHKKKLTDMKTYATREANKRKKRKAKSKPRVLPRFDAAGAEARPLGQAIEELPEM